MTVLPSPPEEASVNAGGPDGKPRRPNPSAQSAPSKRSGAEAAGDHVGDYRLLRLIGEGGMGSVWLAEQQKPVRRRVALKVIKLGMDTREVIGRFEAERQALALMDHPGIARALDAGSTENGRPYFVMELVNGVPITQYCDNHKLGLEERLRLFIDVCHAIQHAHQKGIIHRDIKPSNILIALNEGMPVAKVIDFGIAKATGGVVLTDKTVFTAVEQFVGTPAYMSPEQAELSNLDIDTRTDIYALGVLLYELLTGTTPFNAKELAAKGLVETRRIIREEEPLRPSARLEALNAEEQAALGRKHQSEPRKLIGQIRGDLDWIVMKALEKFRTRRYETANGLAMDVERYLNSEPVIARPPSTLYRFQRMVGRNRVAFSMGGTVFIALVLGVAVSAWQAVRATRAEHEQIQLRLQAEEAKATAQQLREKAGDEMNDIGLQFMTKGQFEPAEVVLRRSLALHNELLSPTNDNSIWAAGNLAILMILQGRQPEADEVMVDLIPVEAEDWTPTYDLHVFRAGYWVHRRQFAQAAAEMRTALELRDDEALSWLRAATVLLTDGDEKGYERLRGTMLTRFGNTSDPRTAEVTAKTCLLLPWAGPDLRQAAKLASQAAKQFENNRWNALAQMLAEYRSADFPGATNWALVTIAMSDQDAATEVAARAVLAMAQFRLGNTNEAGLNVQAAAALARQRLVERLYPIHLFDEADSWQNVLVARILLDEASTIPALAPFGRVTATWQELLQDAFVAVYLKRPIRLVPTAAAFIEGGDAARALAAQRQALGEAHGVPDHQELANGLELLINVADQSDPKADADRDVFSAIYAYPGGYLGQLAGNASGSWREGKTDFSETYHFQELERDDDIILLRDVTRRYRIQIPVQGGMARLSTDDGRTWRDLYQVQKVYEAPLPSA